MADTVKVSLVQGQSIRLSPNEDYIKYGPGVHDMPIEHAEAMGVLHRVVKDGPEGATVVKDPFQGRVSVKLTDVLEKAGYHSLDDLRKLNDDQLRAIPGVGPDAYERIIAAMKGA